MNRPLKILIADDESDARELLIHYLRDRGEDTELSEASNGNEVAKLLSGNESWDILFLDIKMPGRNVIDLLGKFRPARWPAIIFTTAFDKYAVHAFDLEAVDYLLKPFDKNRFTAAFKRATNRMQLADKELADRYISKLTIKTGTKISVVNVAEIECFQADGVYVTVRTPSRMYSMNGTMRSLENSLDPLCFARVHKSYIVNISKVSEIHSLRNGDYELIMTSGFRVRASRTYRNELRSLF